MSLNDTVSDMLNRIMNATRASQPKAEVDVIYSKLTVASWM